VQYNLQAVTIARQPGEPKVEIKDIVTDKALQDIYHSLSKTELDELRTYAALNREETDIILPKIGQAAVSHANAVHREMEEMVSFCR
jgi:hypothetical protein